jgi:hypothetical protein
MYLWNEETLFNSRFDNRYLINLLFFTRSLTDFHAGVLVLESSHRRLQSSVVRRELMGFAQVKRVEYLWVQGSKLNVGKPPSQPAPSVHMADIATV